MSLNDPHLPLGLGLWLTLSDSNYPYLDLKDVQMYRDNSSYGNIDFLKRVSANSMASILCTNRLSQKHCLFMQGHHITWVGTLNNAPSGMCAQRRLGSACAFAQSDQSLRCPPEVGLTLHPGLPAERTADAQADLSLRWALISYGTFSHAKTVVYSVKTNSVVCLCQFFNWIH